MNGYGSHTFQWINAEGERFWVKYHFKSDQGAEGMDDEAAGQLAGNDADVHIRDLHDAIDSGDAPSWTLYVQVMAHNDAVGYRFNPFDVTKIWPHSDYPLIKVGTMLLARIFSYADAHRYRVGTNYAQLPVNAPRSEVHSYSKDGHMRHGYRDASEPVYAPNSTGGPAADPARANDGAGWASDGEMTRAAATLHAEDDDFGQAGSLYRDVMDDAEKARFVETVAGHLGQVTRPDLLERVFEYWTNVDADLGARLRAAVTA